MYAFLLIPSVWCCEALLHRFLFIIKQTKYLAVLLVSDAFSHLFFFNLPILALLNYLYCIPTTHPHPTQGRVWGGREGTRSWFSVC